MKKIKATMVWADLPKVSEAPRYHFGERVIYFGDDYGSVDPKSAIPTNSPNYQILYDSGLLLVAKHIGRLRIQGWLDAC